MVARVFPLLRSDRGTEEAELSGGTAWYPWNVVRSLGFLTYKKEVDKHTMTKWQITYIEPHRGYRHLRG